MRKSRGDNGGQKRGTREGRDRREKCGIFVRGYVRGFGAQTCIKPCCIGVQKKGRNTCGTSTLIGSGKGEEGGVTWLEVVVLLLRFFFLVSSAPNMIYGTAHLIAQYSCAWEQEGVGARVLLLWQFAGGSPVYFHHESTCCCRHDVEQSSSNRPYHPPHPHSKLHTLIQTP